MKIRNILIIEDEKRNFNRLQRLLTDIDPDYSIDGPITSIGEGVDYLGSHEAPDLIFADIRLADGLSFEIFRQVNAGSPIIFTTAYDEYAVQAFKYNSIDYLLKPVDSEELCEAISKAETYSKAHEAPSKKDYGENLKELLEMVKQSNSRYRERFLISGIDGYESISVKDINHIMLKDRTVLAFLEDGRSKAVPFSLDDLESQLDPAKFFRANRQFLINIDSVRKVSFYFNSRLLVHLRNYPDTEVVVSRERATALKDWLNK